MVTAKRPPPPIQMHLLDQRRPPDRIHSSIPIESKVELLRLLAEMVRVHVERSESEADDE